MSSPKKVLIEAVIYKLLVSDCLDGFTLVMLRDAYIDHLALRSTPEEVGAHRKVYRQVLRLQKHGLLVQIKQAGKSINYYKTPLFHETTFVKVFSKEAIKETAFSQAENTFFATVQLPIVEQLQRQASQYQFDLQSCISESEEYQRLGNEFPGIRFQFEAGYHESTQRRSKLQGQLRAIENVLMQYTEKVISYSEGKSQ